MLIALFHSDCLIAAAVCAGASLPGGAVLVPCEAVRSLFQLQAQFWLGLFKEDNYNV